MAVGTPVTVLETAEAVGDLAAEIALWGLLRGQREHGRMTLGCPAGRSPRGAYAALAGLALLATTAADASAHTGGRNGYAVIAVDGAGARYALTKHLQE